MNGPAHYRDAERLLALADDSAEVTHDRLVSQAQVHATLALAAATANVSEIIRASGPDRHHPDDADVAWIKVIS
jgi:hypothetical protein